MIALTKQLFTTLIISIIQELWGEYRQKKSRALQDIDQKDVFALIELIVKLVISIFNVKFQGSDTDDSRAVSDIDALVFEGKNRYMERLDRIQG